MSEDARVTLLEEVRSRLERGIEHCRTAALHLSQIEKQLILTEVLEEPGTLQQDLGEIWATVADILDEAEKLYSKIKSDRDNALLKYQTKYLRILSAAGTTSFSDGSSRPPSKGVGKKKEAILDEVIGMLRGSVRPD